MSDIPLRPMLPGEIPVCERILRALPEWFGIEESLRQYVADLATLETIVADDAGQIVGFLGVRLHNPFSAEIHVMGVLPSHHGRGVGRAMVERVERELRGRGVEFLQVKTLGPRRPNAAYAQTRAFYERLGFRPLEENDLWGSVNPCLILVKHLACSDGGQKGQTWLVAAAPSDENEVPA